MEEKNIGITERDYTIEDLHMKKDEQEKLEQELEAITKELQEEVERD